MQANKTVISRLQRGFTLVELLIVVIILAILAAIVIPQFSSSTVDAQEASLDSNLSAMRSAIELYKAQHNGVYPGANTAVIASCSTGSPSANGAGAGAFIDQLTQYTNSAGGACSGPATQTTLGPYLRKGIPNEPISNKGSLAAEIAVTTTGAALAPSAATGGWAYDSKSGQFVMNSNANDSKTKAYSTH